MFNKHFLRVTGKKSGEATLFFVIVKMKIARNIKNKSNLEVFTANYVTKKRDVHSWLQHGRTS
jgi:hypothetical protein